MPDGETQACLSTFGREQENKQKGAAGSLWSEVTAHQRLLLRYTSVAFPCLWTLFDLSLPVLLTSGNLLGSHVLT